MLMDAFTDFTETWDATNIESRPHCVPVGKIDIIETLPLVVYFNNHKRSSKWGGGGGEQVEVMMVIIRATIYIELLYVRYLYMQTYKVNTNLIDILQMRKLRHGD